MDCQSAIAIRNTNSDSLRALDDLSILDAIVNRLDSDLRVQWLQHRRTTSTPTFQLFSEWVKTWAEISRLDKDTMSHHNQPYLETTLKLKTTSTPTTPKVVHTTNPGGDKEYRDTLKKRRDISPALSVNKGQAFQKNVRPQSPRPSGSPRGRDTSPKPTNQAKNSGYKPLQSKLPINPLGGNMELQCAWCYHLNIPHQHTTIKCRSFTNAEVADRWHIIYRNRLCQKCLLPGHYWRECESSTPPCTVCKLPHHATLGCRPEESISLYPRDQ